MLKFGFGEQPKGNKSVWSGFPQVQNQQWPLLKMTNVLDIQ
jgi:hypothetical protein